MHPGDSQTKKAYTFTYIDPETDEQQETTVHIPGKAWDSVFKKEVEILSLHPDNPEAFFLLAPDIKRSQEHICAVPASHDTVEPDDASTSLGWNPCPHNALEPAVLSKLQSAVLDACTIIPFLAESEHPRYQLFVERVVKAYAHLHSKFNGPDAGMHANREAVCTQAIKLVMAQIPPRTRRPHKGSVKRATISVLPALEIMFSMPSSGPKRGTKGWIDSLLSKVEAISFRDMVDFPELRRAYIKDVIANSDANGKIILKDGECPPEKPFNFNTVKPSSVIRAARRQMFAHPNLFALRAGGVRYAINMCRNEGLYPRKMLHSSLPAKVQKSRKRWDNYAKFINAFHVYYCVSQNFSRSDDEAREALVYLFHGKGLKYSPGTQTWSKPSILALLHKRIQTGHHRFTAIPKIKQHWDKLINLIDSHPDYKIYLDDKGSGSPPMEYLVVVENCLRSFGTDPNALGKFAMASRDEWHKVDIWRKRECYIAAARYILGLPGYLKYISFRWSDYVSRASMTKTFNLRHKPITTGQGDVHVPDSDCWDNTINHRARKPFVRVPRVNGKDDNDTTSTNADEPELIWDSENEEWVEKE